MGRITKGMILTGLVAVVFIAPVFAEESQGRVVRVLGGGDVVTVEQLDSKGTPMRKLDLKISDTSRLTGLVSLNDLTTGDVVNFEATMNSQNASLPWSVTSLSKFDGSTATGQLSPGATAAHGISTNTREVLTAQGVSQSIGGAGAPSHSFSSQTNPTGSQTGTSGTSTFDQTYTASVGSSGGTASGTGLVRR